ncbi:secreted protein [Neofusicoccum parvum]|nr:secreted protein [Neofusicoccum parvum]
MVLRSIHHTDKAWYLYGFSNTSRFARTGGEILGIITIMLLVITCLIFLMCSTFNSAELTEEPRANFTLAELYALQTRIFDTTLSLTPTINSTLLHPDIRGRVDITRQFTGRELNTEYLFGLFAQLNATQAFTLLGTPTGYRITHFTGHGDTAASATLMDFSSPFWGAFALELHVWSRFDARGRVAQYDATFRHWAAFVGEALARVARERFGGDEGAAVAFAAARLVGEVCAAHETHCRGADRQYASEAECRAFLAAEVPFGLPHEMGRDTLLCRMVHAPMVPLRPAVHCKHIGPRGGDMCEDGFGYGERIDQGFWRESWMPDELSAVF